MKILRKISLIIVVISMVLIVGGCGKKVEEESLNNFNLKYEAEQTVDKVIYKIAEFENELNPIHGETEIKKGHTIGFALEEEELNLALEIIDNSETIYKVEDIKIDLTNGKKVDFEIVNDKDGKMDVKLINQ